ncbi:hypothetical protein P7L75_12425 [Tistrella mobilis]|uniref:hypothetical protein n=1 Tax=Tistrella mobilis TaxID=171437 RepID=UPI003555D97F
MARRRRRRGGRGETGTVIGLVLAVVAILVILGAGGWLWFGAERPTKRDPESLCPADGRLAGITVILIDSSDPLPEIGRREVKTLLTDIATRAAVNERIDLRVMTPENGGSRSLFSRCNPGDGSDLDEWTANPALARKRWITTFERPLAEALGTGLAPHTADVSPIMSAIQGIAVDSFAGQAVADLPKSLVIVSDMVENTPLYSQFRGDLRYDTFRASPAYRQYHTDLKDASVTLFYIERATSRFRSVEHVRFWGQWIVDNLGRPGPVHKLQGAG